MKRRGFPGSLLGAAVATRVGASDMPPERDARHYDVFEYDPTRNAVLCHLDGRNYLYDCVQHVWFEMLV